MELTIHSAHIAVASVGYLNNHAVRFLTVLHIVVFSRSWVIVIDLVIVEFLLDKERDQAVDIGSLRITGALTLTVDSSVIEVEITFEY
jgi:hypothetical protein